MTGSGSVAGHVAVPGGPDEARRPSPPGAQPTITTAWVVIAVISAAPAIVWTEVTGSTPGWLIGVQLGVLAGLLLGSVAWPVLRPLRRFAVVMIAFLVVLNLPNWMDLSWMPLQRVFGATPFDTRMQAEQTEKLLVTLVIIGVLLALGYKRRSFFLTTGNLRAPIRPVRLLGFPRRDPWSRFGLLWSIFIAGALAVALALTGQLPKEAFAAVVPMLPSIVFYAALNAFNEEMTYRAPMLATLEPAEGSTAALGQSAMFFGIAHYFGTPGGLIGAALSIFMGWILGKAMVETRGLFWPWWIHFLSDVVIFVFLAAGLVR
jgi:membrane protease YdiL (CAAX protease family)